MSPKVPLRLPAMPAKMIWTVRVTGSWGTFMVSGDIGGHRLDDDPLHKSLTCKEGENKGGDGEFILSL